MLSHPFFYPTKIGGTRTMDIDATNLMLSLLAGTIGMGMLMVGKRTGRMMPIGVGVALMTFPYFIPNAVILATVCSALVALPFIFRDA
jgi:hypothetical protein